MSRYGSGPLGPRGFLTLGTSSPPFDFAFLLPSTAPQEYETEREVIIYLEGNDFVFSIRYVVSFRSRHIRTGKMPAK